MLKDLANTILDELDCHFNKVKYHMIERMLPQLYKMLEKEMKGMIS